MTLGSLRLRPEYIRSEVTLVHPPLLQLQKQTFLVSLIGKALVFDSVYDRTIQLPRTRVILPFAKSTTILLLPLVT